jgi:glucan-binding YG repeat protein
MDYGWFRDEKNDWYHCNELANGWFGKMDTGWFYSTTDTNWYYLDPVSGQMQTGWKQIGDKWYYFTEQNSMPTYEKQGDVWVYLQNAGRPYGSMYVNETTPDGYRVGADGAWIE